jgi:hypothetical protein
MYPSHSIQPTKIWYHRKNYGVNTNSKKGKRINTPENDYIQSFQHNKIIIQEKSRT